MYDIFFSTHEIILSDYTHCTDQPCSLSFPLKNASSYTTRRKIWIQTLQTEKICKGNPLKTIYFGQYSALIKLLLSMAVKYDWRQAGRNSLRFWVDSQNFWWFLCGLCFLLVIFNVHLRFLCKLIHISKGFYVPTS